MKKQKVALILLITYVLSCFTSCIIYETCDEIQRIKSLPHVVYDDNSNILYNGSTYIASHNPINPFGFKSEGYPIAQTEYWGLPDAVMAYGIEDFGEYVYLDLSGFAGQDVYYKSDFEFPDYLAMKCSGIYLSLDCSQIKGEKIIDLSNNDNLYLKDILIESNLDNYDHTNWKAYVKVHFADYQTIYLDRASLYLYEGTARKQKVDL